MKELINFIIWLNDAPEVRQYIKLEFLILGFFLTGAIANAVDKPSKIKARTYKIICFVTMAFIFWVFIVYAIQTAPTDGNVSILTAIFSGYIFRIIFFFCLIVILFYQMLRTCYYSRRREVRLERIKEKRRLQE